MSKEMTAADVAAWFEKRGLEKPETLVSEVANSVQNDAQREIASHLSTNDEKKKVKSAEEWQVRLFTLAENMQSDFTGQEKNVGQGRAYERYVEVTLPGGIKLAIRHREPREKK